MPVVMDTCFIVNLLISGWDFNVTDEGIVRRHYIYWTLRKYSCISDDQIYEENFKYRQDLTHVPASTLNYFKYYTTATLPNFGAICEEEFSSLAFNSSNVHERTVPFKSGMSL